MVRGSPTLSEERKKNDAAEADDQAIEDLEIELKMKRDQRDDKYRDLDQKRSKVGQGVAGDPAYGDDSPLYGAMGFVRKSEKKSGLTRKKKTSWKLIFRWPIIFSIGSRSGVRVKTI